MVALDLMNPHLFMCPSATRGRPPPVQVRMQIICTDSIIVDTKSGAKQS